MAPLKVVIVGAGAAGYFAAAAIRKNLPHIDVTVVYDPNVPTIGVGESISWFCPGFMNKYLGLTDELKWMQEAQSTYKNAIEFVGFDGTQNSKFFAAPNNFIFDDIVSSGENTHYDLWMHLRARGMVSGDPQEYFGPLYWLVLDNKVQLDSSRQHVVSNNPYSYHLNADLAGGVIHKLVGIPNGVKEIPMRVRQVVLDDRGSIDYLELEDLQKVKADLFIDASGFTKLLVNELPFEFEPCDEYFNNSAIVGRHFYSDHSEYKSRTLSQAMDWGWHFSVPVAGKSGEGYVFNSRWTPDIDRLAQELHDATGKTDVKFRHITWEPGYYKTSFVNNCIALGISQGFSEPFDANGFSMTLRHIARMVDNMKTHSLPEQWKGDYNQFTRALCDDIIFRVQTAFHLALKNNTPYWQELKVAAAKFHTKEKLLDAIFDQNRKTLPTPTSNHSYGFGQHLFVHQALYSQVDLPVERCLLNIDSATEQNALEFMQQLSAQNKAYANRASSAKDFYKSIYPNLLK